MATHGPWHYRCCQRRAEGNGIPRGSKKKNYVGKNPFFRGVCLWESVRFGFKMSPHAEGSITFPWSYEELKETSGGGASGRLVGNWRHCLCWSYWDPSPCFLSPSLLGIRKWTTHTKLKSSHRAPWTESAETRVQTNLSSFCSSYLFTSFFLFSFKWFMCALWGLHVRMSVEPRGCLDQLLHGCESSKLRSSCLCRSTVMAVLSPQPPVSLKLLPRVFWHSKSANRKRKLS